mmetsp:Transcript_5172/g.7978  ORF Transcript_5172/g.7978 Transcript_5172/m.7978 type:complete len:167 (+) Transcript_5172:646-1146(+)
MQVLRQYRLTSELCEQTLLKILCEAGKIKLFRPGQLVMNCHPRSPVNLEARKIYDLEYGHHMREEINEAVEANMKSISRHNFTLEQSLMKSSPLGSFFSMVNRKMKQRQDQGVSEEEYYKLRRKPKEEEVFNKPGSRVRSLCIVLQGGVRVVNKTGNFEVIELFSG